MTLRHRLQQRIENIIARTSELSALSAVLPLIKHGNTWYIDYQQGVYVDPDFIELKTEPKGNLLTIVTLLKGELTSLNDWPTSLTVLDIRLRALEARLQALKNRKNGEF
jgi:hypothetical protein